MVTRCKGRLYCSFCINLIKSVVFAIKFAILLRISGNISMYLVNILILDLVWKVLLSSINPKYVTSTDDKVELKKVQLVFQFLPYTTSNAYVIQYFEVYKVYLGLRASKTLRLAYYFQIHYKYKCRCQNKKRLHCFAVFCIRHLII